MIPKLPNFQILPKPLSLFLDELQRRGFQGDVDHSLSSRLVSSTDNSIYQVVPEAILFPKSQEDVCLALALAGEEEFRDIPFTARGGGTGTNGQSLNSGLVMDLSRHMNQILEISLAEGWVRVQSGVVLDQLNEYLRPMGYFFAPDLSPSNRATLGGMCNTDACGKGSRIYGKTSDHIQGLELVYVDGTRYSSVPIDREVLDQLKNEDSLNGRVHRLLDEILEENQDLISQIYPKLTRFLTGYNLSKIWGIDGRFNLNYLISGSEGTLAFVTELKLKLTPIPKQRRLILAKYRSFDDSLRAARVLVDADPAAIETVDDTIVGLARQDIIWHKIAKFFSAPEDSQVASVNLIEFVGDDLGQLEQKVESLLASLKARLGQDHEAVGFHYVEAEDDISALWSLRKKGVGLLGNRPGHRRPVPFVEDTVVPPENLADFIRDFRQVLDSHGLEYGMFGHVDAGCLHVRPALDLKDEEDEKLIRIITDKVKDLVKSYGGIIWGEHGKGLRSEYMPEFFGEELFTQLRRIKGAFDADNRLNPGKLVTPLGSAHQVTKLDEAPMRGQRDRQIPNAVREDFALSINCNGNGACFNYKMDDVMCPSYKLSRNRVHSPKGRAGLMREWLRQLSLKDFNPLTAELNQGNAKMDAEDFSVEVYEAMNGCLSCKGCSGSCPIKVDIPELKSRFLELFHSRYRRPLKDYMLASGEGLHKKLVPVPWLYNLAMAVPGFDFFMAKFAGLVDSPRLSSPSYLRQLSHAGVERLYFDDIARWQGQKESNLVFVLADQVSAFYEADEFVAILNGLRALGLRPVVPEYMDNGKPLHVKGFLKAFRKTASETGARLAQLEGIGAPIIGIDPALTLVYREEYARYGGGPYKVLMPQEFLVDYLKGRPWPKLKGRYRFLGHCGEVTSSPSSSSQWRSIFAEFALDLEIGSQGCCGMAGAFGHEAQHLEESRGIYQMSWQTKVESSDVPVLATGASCRSQVKRFSKLRVRHPIAVLGELLA